MDKKTEYIEKLSAEIVEWDLEIELLKDKARSVAPGIRLESACAIATLQFRRDEAAIKLQGLGNASNDEWDELKTGAEGVRSEISSILHDAIMKIK